MTAVPRPMPPLRELDFNNTAIAFAHLSNYELRRAYWLFRVIGNPFLAKVGPKVASASVDMGLPVKWAIRGTVFQQFCGGEDIKDCQRTIRRLASAHIGTILDYSVEGKESDQDFQRCENIVIDTIHLARGNPAVPFCVFKVTGLAPFSLLEKVSAGGNLDAATQAAFAKVQARVDRICRHAYEAGVKVFVDAEETWIQGAIDRLFWEAAGRYNQQTAIVYNTCQMYRRDRLAALKEWYSRAKAEGIFLGIKLVRGAYMEKERKRAAEKSYPSPIHASKQETDHDFDAALSFCLQHRERIALCAGSHNEHSTRFLAESMEKKGLARNDPHVAFAQLLGMSDNLSYSLAHFGFNVAKYVPFGPIKDVLPYLGRRAAENTSVAGQSGRELALIEKEMRRRGL